MSGLSDRELKLLQQYISDSAKARSEQEIKFYAAVGRGISSWSKMEEDLVRIAARLLRSKERKVGLVMYSINFYAWIQVIDDLFVLDGSYPRSLDLWRGMVKSLKGENDVRVQLAHHAIFHDALLMILGMGGMQVRLQAARLDTRTKTRRNKPLVTSEIEDFSMRVEKLHARVKVLLARMQKRKSLR
jgi:hypothetical protein